MTFVWTSPDPLNNTAKTRSIYITELQNAVNTKRADIGLAPITFIDQSVGKKFRLDAIEELKTVTNDLAILYGYTGVEDSALLGRPYVSITKKYGKTVCHYPILNDLRLVLNLIEIAENLLVFGRVLTPPESSIAACNITEGPLSVDRWLGLLFPEESISVDRINLFILRDTVGACYISKRSLIDGSIIGSSVLISGDPKDITVDTSYCWALVHASGNNQKIARLNKGSLTNVVEYSLTNLIDDRSFLAIINDKDYIYLLGSKRNTDVHPTISYVRELVIRKYDKSDMFSYTEFIIDKYLVPPSPRTGNDPNIRGWDIAIDEDYLYITCDEEINMLLEPSIGPPYVRTSAGYIMKMNKNTMVIDSALDDSDQASRFYEAGISSSDDYLYVFGRFTWPSLEYAVYDKVGSIKTKASTIDGYTVYSDASRRITCTDEYKVTLV